MTAVRDNPEEDRYEIRDHDQLAGFSENKLTEALDDARRRKLALLPLCPYVRKVIASDPAQYLDLVPPGDRERFELPDGAEVDGPGVELISGSDGTS